MRGSGSPPPARLAERSSVIAQSAWPASYSGTRSRRGPRHRRRPAPRISRCPYAVLEREFSDLLERALRAPRGQPRAAWPAAARGALALIRAYKYLFSPWFTGACRFVPTCADYTAEAIARHGLWSAAAWLWRPAGLAAATRFGARASNPVPDPTEHSSRLDLRPLMERRVLLAIALSFVVLFALSGVFCRLRAACQDDAGNASAGRDAGQPLRAGPARDGRRRSCLLPLPSPDRRRHRRNAKSPSRRKRCVPCLPTAAAVSGTGCSRSTGTIEGQPLDLIPGIHPAESAAGRSRCGSTMPAATTRLNEAIIRYLSRGRSVTRRQPTRSPSNWKRPKASGPTRCSPRARIVRHVLHRAVSRGTRCSTRPSSGARASATTSLAHSPDPSCRRPTRITRRRSTTSGRRRRARAPTASMAAASSGKVSSAGRGRRSLLHQRGDAARDAGASRVSSRCRFRALGAAGRRPATSPTRCRFPPLQRTRAFSSGPSSSM